MCAFRRWLYSLPLILLSSCTLAAGVTYQTVRVGPASYAPNGVTSPITVNVAPAGGVPRYQQIVPVASPSSIGRLGRSLVRGGGVGLVITGAVEGLGYLIDQASGQITKTVETPVDGGWNGSFNVMGFTATSPEQACAKASHPYSSRITVGDNPGYFGYCYKLLPDGGTYARWNILGSGNYQEPTTVITQEPLTASEMDAVDQTIFNNLSLYDKSRVIQTAVAAASPRGTLDTSQYPLATLASSNSDIEQLFSEWPELRTALHQLMNAELAAALAASDPTFEPAPADQAIADQGTTAPPMESPTEPPVFCEWASFLCDPVALGEQPPVPLIDLEAPTYDSGLPTTAACPSPVAISLLGFGLHEVAYDPICSMADAIRTPLIAMAYLFAAFTVVGVRR